jgi:diguanylate cyclase (GGDEF)-like protein/PAS domain S-box-containing protein
MEKTMQTVRQPFRSCGGDTVVEGVASVLLVTAKADLTEAVRNALHHSKGLRFGVVPVADAKVARKRLAQLGVDAVILDEGAVEAPTVGSISAAVQAFDALPVVVLVDASHRERGVEAVQAGAFAYLIKEEIIGGLLSSTVDSAIQHDRRQRHLRASEERLTLALCGTEHGVWDWDLQSDRLFTSARWNLLLGLLEMDLETGPEHWLSRVHRDDLASLKRAIQGHLKGNRAQLDAEFRMRCGDGEGFRWMSVQGMAAFDEIGEPRRLAGCLRDIDERKLSEQQILHDAMHDCLTGLPNRMLFIDRVSLAMARQSRHPESRFAVLFLDLDDFKQINDTYGHACGDRVLVGISERLTKFLRPEDTVSRLCGDEFAVLLSEVGDRSVTMQVAERLREVLGEPLVIDGHRLTPGVSIGVVLSSDEYRDPREMLHDADVAMYRSKACGGSSCQLFDAELHQSAIALFSLEAELREAVATREFVMHYQPIVDLKSAETVGFEGLVRWDHPKEGLLPAARFLAIAEATGLVIPIGWWVLETACRQMTDWQRRFPREHPLWIGVNISGKLFRQHDTVPRLQSILESTGLAPEFLRIEIAENIISKHGDEAISRLSELRGIGVRLSVDDFGSDFSSLALVDRFRFDSLKIDPACLAGIGDGGESPALMRTILAVAETLDMGVIAEGVETSSQAAFLMEKNCPQGQGFWFAKPLAPDAAERTLRA